MIDRLVVTTGVEIEPAKGPADGDGCGIELLRDVTFEQRLVDSALRRQREGVPLVRCRVFRIELERSTKFVRRTVPIPVVNKQAPRQRGVRFRKCLIERERL